MTEPSAPEIAAIAGELRVALAQLLRRLREQTPGTDLTKSQSAVLSRLEREGPSTTTALARAEGIRQQSMAAIITALDTAGLISGTPDPKDGRKTTLNLTEKAREQFRSGRLAKEDWLTQAMSARLSREEIGRLGDAVELIRRLTEG